MLEAFNEEHFEDALRLSRLVRAESDKYALALIIQTRCLLLLERHAEALAILNANADYLCDSGAAWSAVAHCQEALGDEGARLEALRQSCQLEPTASRLVLLGDALARTRDLAGAEKALRQALEMKPNCSEAKANLAYWIVPSTDRNAKESLFREAIQDDSENAFAWEQLGLILWCDPSRHEEAEQALSNGLALSSTLSYGRVALADLLWRREDVDGAKRHYQQLVNERSPFVADRVGEFFTACRDFQTAERVYLRSLEECENADVLMGYGKMLELAGQRELGVVLIQRAKVLGITHL